MAQKPSGDGIVLPPEYQRVSYIQSTGTQYIDTGIVPHISFAAEVEFESTKAAGDPVQSFMGGGYDYGYGDLAYSFQIKIDENNLTVRMYTLSGSVDQSKRTGAVFDFSDPAAIAQRLVYKFNQINLAASVGKTEGVFTIGDSRGDARWGVFLFATGDYSKSGQNRAINRASGKMYHASVSDINGLLLNLYPCFRKADGEIGMYDLVSGTFFANAGTGTFEKGANV